jgi:Lrp/AsnC family transcriptional regulator, leucine-responsive regulatory protein
MKLDEKDVAILAILRSNSRLSNRDLSRRIGLSPSACLARVRRLEKQRVIIGYRAIVAPEERSSLFEGWANLRFVDPSPASPQLLSNVIATTPEIVAAYRVAGRFEYLLRVRAKDVAAWTSCQHRLEGLDGQPQVHVSIVLEALK